MRLTEFMENRDKTRLNMSLVALRQAAAGEENLMPYLIATAKTYATLGEIGGVLREVVGEYTVASEP